MKVEAREEETYIWRWDQNNNAINIEAKIIMIFWRNNVRGKGEGTCVCDLRIRRN